MIYIRFFIIDSKKFIAKERISNIFSIQGLFEKLCLMGLKNVEFEKNGGKNDGSKFLVVMGINEVARFDPIWRQDVLRYQALSYVKNIINTI